MLPHHTFFRFLGMVAAIVLVGARTDDLEAHKISGECFLKGTYMEIGIHAVRRRSAEMGTVPHVAAHNSRPLHTDWVIRDCAGSPLLV